MFTIFAPAKINLGLDILHKRSDGYHEIDTVMQSIALADQLSLEVHDQIELSCNVRSIPTDCSNLAWRAAQLLQEKAGTTKGVKIHITKNIPVAAGLAGGSADAAAVLVGLNKLWDLNLSVTEIMDLGIKLGADVPFCIRRGTVRAGGIGEKFTEIKSKIKCSLLLVTPNIEISTVSAYGRLQLEKIKIHPRMDQVVSALEEGNLDNLTGAWGNVFEEVILEDYPKLAKVKESFQQFGLHANLMSGSGPSVFALNPPNEVIEPFLAAIPSEWFCSFSYFQS